MDSTPKRMPLCRDLRAAVWDMTRGRCWCCGDDTNPFERFCVDHVVPLARGGTDDIANLVPCCRYCNARKGVLLVDEWRANFARSAELDESPWTREDRRFWFEGGDLGPARDSRLDPEFIASLRDSEVRAWQRFGGRSR